MLHSGLDYGFDNGKHYVFVPPATSKSVVAQRYNMCRYANAIRREQPSFELANIEAPLANAIPITLDREDYRRWFAGSSIMLEESELENQLVDLFAKDQVKPDWSMYKRSILESFNWKHAVCPFWEKIMNGS